MAELLIPVSLFDVGGVLHTFCPGDAIPDWARARITNPNVWSIPDAESITAVVGGPPPQTGPGASRQLWVTYAHTNNVVVQDGWKRDDIIAACRQAGVPV